MCCLKWADVIKSSLSQAGRLMMEFACGFVYVPPSVSQKDGQRSTANVVKRSGGISFQTPTCKTSKKKINTYNTCFIILV